MGMTRSLMLAALIAATAGCAQQVGDGVTGEGQAVQERDANAASAAVKASDEAGLLKDAAQDPRAACRQHCTMNHAACRRTANSPEARDECFAAYNDCTRSC